MYRWIHVITEHEMRKLHEFLNFDYIKRTVKQATKQQHQQHLPNFILYHAFITQMYSIEQD
jgi:hypothetical protein